MGRYTSYKYADRKWTRRCSACGREHHVGICYEYHFMTMDGGDSMSDDYCWMCEVVGRLVSAKQTVKGIGKRIAFVAELLVLSRNPRKIPKYWRWSRVDS